MLSQLKTTLAQLNVDFTVNLNKVLTNGLVVTYRKDAYGGYLLGSDPNEVSLGMFESVNDCEFTEVSECAKKLRKHQKDLSKLKSL